MRVLLDTNVLVDIVLRRPQFHADSQAVLDRIDVLNGDGFVAWHSLATVFYLVEKVLDNASASRCVSQILLASTVATTGDTEARRAEQLDFDDYEDAMIAAAAEVAQCDCIETRDATGFSNSPVPAVTPTEFLARFGQP